MHTTFEISLNDYYLQKSWVIVIYRLHGLEISFIVYYLIKNKFADVIYYVYV